MEGNSAVKLATGSINSGQFFWGSSTGEWSSIILQCYSPASHPRMIRKSKSIGDSICCQVQQSRISCQIQNILFPVTI